MWAAGSRGLVDLPAGRQNLDVESGMALAWRDEANGAVAVRVVVPMDETLDPCHSCFDRGEWLRWYSGQYLRVLKSASM